MFTVDRLREDGLILMEHITGSHAYGTNIPSSDTDIKGVYVLPQRYFASTDYDPKTWDEVAISDDHKYYELRKFVRMLGTNNPNMLESLALPEGCLLYKHPAFDEVLKRKDEFLSKLARKTFEGYAYDQIKKAFGQDKMQNWENEAMVKLDLIDFCYTFQGWGSVPIQTWLVERGMKQEHCGLVAINHMRYTYAVFYDETGKLFNGILRPGSLTLSVSAVPKGYVPICNMQANIDGWGSYCKKWKSYQTWLLERNDARWVDVKGHGQKIDGKNMLHMIRLLNMSRDIAEGRGIVVRRPEAEELLKIRRGEVDLQSLLDRAQDMMDHVGSLYEKSSLPEKPRNGLAHETMEAVRDKFPKYLS